MVTVLAADVLIAIVTFCVLGMVSFHTLGETGTALLHEQFVEAMFLGGGVALALMIGAGFASRRGAMGVAVFQCLLVALAVAYMVNCADAFHLAVSTPIQR